MRKVLLAGTTLAALVAIPTVASAQYYGDPYGPSPLFGYPPPPAYGYAPPPPAYGYAAPQAGSQVYLAPGQTYVAPGTAYQDQAIIIEGRRYYRDCWWDWGQRKCALKPYW